jgi:hypothetical protein
MAPLDKNNNVFVYYIQTHYKQRGMYPVKYVPLKLSQKDRKTQRHLLAKSRKLYKKGIYVNRVKDGKTLSSYPHKTSKHISHAEKIYTIKNIHASPELAKKTGCSVKALAEIERKGEGAYYSSGSRPNQTAQSWGRARLASAITAGKAAAVDYSILEKGCSTKSKALTLAKKAVKKHGHGTRRVPKKGGAPPVVVNTDDVISILGDNNELLLFNRNDWDYDNDFYDKYTYDGNFPLSSVPLKYRRILNNHGFTIPLSYTQTNADALMRRVDTPISFSSSMSSPGSPRTPGSTLSRYDSSSPGSPYIDPYQFFTINEEVDLLKSPPKSRTNNTEKPSPVRTNPFQWYPSPPRFGGPTP